MLKQLLPKIKVLSQKIRVKVNIVAIKNTGGNNMIQFQMRSFQKGYDFNADSVVD
ncbi:hypothetical protein LDG_6294 [Legionella drancourtii LLAP12]|uniref:Uncharacterized protein n=1 Tax=Legionella drancourtii LLAP12 TaxID=658187 RepID=G9EM32_9GAMM|nr:hypothetical protein LDG_6294 [Legionella drancourtii LLAP12]